MIPLIAVLFWVLLGFVGLAFLETTVERELAGGEGTKGWRKSLFGYKVKEYHFWLWFVVVPIFVFSPLAVVGPDVRLFGTLAAAYLLGGVLEDFVYFLVNPHFGLKKWNSMDASWMPWFKVGRLEVPRFYVRNIVAASLTWFFLIWY